MRKRHVEIWRNGKWVRKELEHVKRGDIFQLYSSTGELVDMSHRGANVTYGLAIYDAVLLANGHSEVDYEAFADIKDKGLTVKEVLEKYPVK